MSDYEMKICDIDLSFEIEKGKILFSGYNLEDEIIANLLSDDEARSEMIAVWQGLQVLLDQGGINKFNEQFSLAKKFWKTYPTLFGDSSTLYSDQGEMCFFLGSIWGGAPWQRQTLIMDMESIDLLSILAHSRSLFHRESAAGNHNIPATMREYFARDKSTRLLIMNNSSTPDSLRRKFLNDPDPKVRHAIAESTKSSQILEILSQDKDRKVLVGVAGNRASSKRTLEKLTSHIYLRVAIMSNSSTPESLRAKFVNDPNVRVRQSIAFYTQNHDILKILSTDSDSVVVGIVRDNSALPKGAFESWQEMNKTSPEKESNAL